jgi:hypothetical protein
MYALFVDFRTAFDKVDREKMFECMKEREKEIEREREIERESERERGISKWLVQKIQEIYVRTINIVKVGEKG